MLFHGIEQMKKLGYDTDIDDVWFLFSFVSESLCKAGHALIVLFGCQGCHVESLPESGVSHFGDRLRLGLFLARVPYARRHTRVGR